MAQESLKAAKVTRELAFLAAADAGWSLREIGGAVGLSVSAVHKVVVAAESRAVENGK